MSIDLEALNTQGGKSVGKSQTIAQDLWANSNTDVTCPRRRREISGTQKNNHHVDFTALGGTMAFFPMIK